MHLHRDEKRLNLVMTSKFQFQNADHDFLALEKA